MNLEKVKFIVAAGLVIIENNKILLNHKKGQDWQLVGGKLSNQDTIDENTLENVCRRETKEEVGIDLEIIRSIKPMIIKHPTEENTLLVLIHYMAKRIGEINLDKDIEEYAWWPIGSLPENIAPNIKIVIDEAMKNNS